MKSISILIMLSVFAASLAGQCAATSYFKVIEYSDVRVAAGGMTNFSVTIQNIGGTGTYARVIFKNLPEGINISNATRARYVYPAGKMKFDLVMDARLASPGDYTSEVGIAAKGSPYNYRPFNLTVYSVPSSTGPSVEAAPEVSTENRSENASGSEGSAEGQNTSTPGPSALLTIAIAAIAGRIADRMRKRDGDS